MFCLLFALILQENEVRSELDIRLLLSPKQPTLNFDKDEHRRSSKRISKTDGLSKTLGMHFISTPEPDTLQATMKVDERNRQPFGFLSGGASLALAENVAGIGSLALCPGQIAVGINVSGTHVLAVSEGDTVTAYAKLVHKGRTLHTWEVAIKTLLMSRSAPYR